jgi:catechol 2,3-dioxygenase-like lactoylglutathione lyase family enzyme
MNAAVSRSADDSMTLHHAALYVSDLAKTRDFYSGVLGMEEIPRPADFTFPGAYFRRDGAEVHVVVETEPDRTAQLRPAWSDLELRTGYVVHFALKVASLDAYLEAMADRGLQPVGGPRIRADHVEQIYLADPDGYVVELMCFHDEATADRRRADLAASGEGVPVAPGHEPRE